MRHFSLDWDTPPAAGSLQRLCNSELQLGDIVSATAEGLPHCFEDMRQHKVKHRLVDVWEQRKKGRKSKAAAISKDILRVCLNYSDMLCTSRPPAQNQDIMDSYVLHALNHLLKTRDLILKNTARLNACSDPEKEFRDQGFTRPKVLIMLPFRSRAKEVVERLIKLAPATISQVENKGKFLKEFGVEEDAADIHPNLPSDYKDMFDGNIDDCFRVGIRLTRRSMKLYTDFYNSDIIIASPLGLRILTGGEGDADRQFDFLSSIEVVIVDEADVMQMQNWDHVETVFKCLSQMPKAQHGADFSRIRNWYLNGWAKYYRQTLIFSSHATAELNALFKRSCFNHSGKVIVHASQTGVLGQIRNQTRQLFQHIECKTISEEDDVRLQYFANSVLPPIIRSEQSHTLIVVRSYFEFVQLRNLLRKKEASYATISEYSTQKNIARSRQYFMRGQRRILLVTERWYFFRRLSIKGAHHMIVFSLPDYAQFYSEWLNSLTSATEVAATVLALYTRFDKLQLERTVGTARTQRMLMSSSNTHLFY